MKIVRCSGPGARAERHGARAPSLKNAVLEAVAEVKGPRRPSPPRQGVGFEEACVLLLRRADGSLDHAGTRLRAFTLTGMRLKPEN